MFEQYAILLYTRNFSCQNEISFLNGQDIRTDDSGVAHPSKTDHGDQWRPQTPSKNWRQNRRKNQRHHDVWKCHEDICDPHNNVIHPTPIIGSDGSQYHSDDHRYSHHQETSLKSGSCTPYDTIQNVILPLGGPQNMGHFCFASHWLVPERYIRHLSFPFSSRRFWLTTIAITGHFEGIFINWRHDQWCKNCHENKNKDQNKANDRCRGLE